MYGSDGNNDDDGISNTKKKAISFCGVIGADQNVDVEDVHHLAGVRIDILSRPIPLAHFSAHENNLVKMSAMLSALMTYFTAMLHVFTAS